jgi:hypothetical protein
MFEGMTDIRRRHSAHESDGGSGGQRRGDPGMAVPCRSQRDEQLAAFDCARVNGCPGHHPVLAKLFAAGQPGDI